MRVLQVHIPGVPQSQGSKRHVGNGVMVESSKHLRPWRADAVAAIQAAMATSTKRSVSGWTGRSGYDLPSTC